MMKTNELLQRASHLIPDEIYLQLMFYKHFHHFADLNNPKTFNEKLQWLKLYDRNPEYTKMVDKIAAKDYVAKMIGSKYIITILDVWNRVEEIDLDTLPDRFVLKCNHDSKGVAICNDRKTFDFEGAKVMLQQHMKQNGYWYGREWPYKNVRPRVFAEKYIETDSCEGLLDYKVLCFNGQAKLCEIHKGRFSDHHTQDMYDCSNASWVKTDIAQGPMSAEVMEPPEFLNEMIMQSEKLAAGMRSVRVDWYYTYRLFFGEITFYDGSGFVGFDRLQDDFLLGSWIDLMK